MVAHRIPDIHAPQAPHHTEEEESSQYIETIDQTQARYDPDSGTVHVFSFHEALQAKRRYSRAEQRELAIKQAALRVLAGLEMRSLRVIAIDIGCTHTAVDNAILRMAKALNMRKFHASEETRLRQSEARRRQLAAVAG